MTVIKTKKNGSSSNLAEKNDSFSGGFHSSQKEPFFTKNGTRRLPIIVSAKKMLETGTWDNECEHGKEMLENMVFDTKVPMS